MVAELRTPYIIYESQGSTSSDASTISSCVSESIEENDVVETPQLKITHQNQMSQEIQEDEDDFNIEDLEIHFWYLPDKIPEGIEVVNPKHPRIVLARLSPIYDAEQLIFTYDPNVKKEDVDCELLEKIYKWQINEDWNCDEHDMAADCQMGTTRKREQEETVSDDVVPAKKLRIDDDHNSAIIEKIFPPENPRIAPTKGVNAADDFNTLGHHTAPCT